MDPLAAVLADPDDLAPRRVYADWLIERGDPRGELINVQCDLALLAPEDPRVSALQLRERRLLKEHKTKWTHGLRGLEFRRGFVESIGNMKVETMLASRGLFEIEPVTAVSIQTRDRKQIPLLAAFEPLRRIRDLTMMIPTLRGPGLQALVDGGRIAGLRALRLYRCGVGRKGIAALAAAGLERLEVLAIAADDLGAKGYEALAKAAGRFPALRELELSGTGLAGDGIRLLARSPIFPRLRRLAIENDPIGDAGAREIAESAKELRELRLSITSIGDDGVRALAGSPGLAALSRLEMPYGIAFGNSGATALAESPHLAGLALLDLGMNLTMDRRPAIGPDGITRLRQRFGERLRVNEPKRAGLLSRLLGR
jgi:uncharacterized protein (TIGR02996 family)